MWKIISFRSHLIVQREFEYLMQLAFSLSQGWVLLLQMANAGYYSYMLVLVLVYQQYCHCHRNVLLFPCNNYINHVTTIWHQCELHAAPVMHWAQGHGARCASCVWHLDLIGHDLCGWQWLRLVYSYDYNATNHGNRFTIMFDANCDGYSTILMPTKASTCCQQ